MADPLVRLVEIWWQAIDDLTTLLETVPVQPAGPQLVEMVHTFMGSPSTLLYAPLSSGASAAAAPARATAANAGGTAATRVRKTHEIVVIVTRNLTVASPPRRQRRAPVAESRPGLR